MFAQQFPALIPGHLFDLDGRNGSAEDSYCILTQGQSLNLLQLICLQAKERLVRAYEDIKDTLAAIYKFYEADSEEVQREWGRFTQNVDKKLEEALRHTVKRSLQELSRLLNGDSKTEVCCCTH